MFGIVIKCIGNRCLVLHQESGEVFTCLIKGNLRVQGIRTTNPVVVGDVVEFFIPQSDLQKGIEEVAAVEDTPIYIGKIVPRRNYIIRKSINLSKEAHILAANIDQAWLVVTVKRPVTSYVFIDRFLATAEAYSVPVYLLFNKIDDLQPAEEDLLHEYLQVYRAIGYPCFTISAREGTGLEAVRPLLSGKITLVSGHSGVGKSTLINSLQTELNLKTAEISAQHETGMHTTTYSQMIPIEEGGFVIDTPGIKGFGTLEMDETNTSHYFREMFALSSQCKFANCTHLHEPGCAVLDALEQGKMSASRYNSYLSILQDATAGAYREEY